MYEKAPKTLLVPKAKGLDPHCQVSKVPPLSPQVWVVGFLFNFRYGLLGKILLSDLSRICMLHADQLDVIPGGTSSKKHRGAHVRYLSMTQRYGKRKNLYPKILVSVPKVFYLSTDPVQCWHLETSKILFQVLTDVQ